MEELDALNRIVSAYLELAELQAMSHKPMHMADWIDKLDEFVRISSRELLTHAGKISHETAKGKAEAEYEKYRIQQSSLPQPVDQHFAEAVEEVKQIDKQTKTPRKKK